MPPPSGGHLVLKCVMATMKIKGFAEVFPEASFVLTHRDPFRALVSGCVTGDTICQPFLKEPPGPLHEDGLRNQDAFNLQKMVLQALVDFANSGQATITHVRYGDLMKDAVAAARSIYDGMGLGAPQGLEKSITDFLEKQRDGKRASPPRRLETFGYHADTVWKDPAVTAYCDLFGVEKERSRLVDTLTES
jgi:hypothetical protein